MMIYFFHLNKLKMFLTAVVLMFVLLWGSMAVFAAEMDYAEKLFDPSFVHSIELSMAPEDWDDLKANPLLKTKYHTDITIDGELFGNVSCATKGNSSLTFVAERGDSERYSFKINFKKYDKDQSYHGLETMSLNNIFDDSTYVKDFLSYTMFRKIGIDAPLSSFVWVKVNGADHGLYLAVEDIDESFLTRTGNTGGVLYKPDSDKLAATGGEMDRIIQDGVQVEDYGEGAELSYRGENIEDYPGIFERAETKAEPQDYLRVIAALKGLSENQDIEAFLDTDEIIKYFAVHNFLLNFDSYTGPMLHNFYLFEKGGRLSLFPWDYNLSFGAFWEFISGHPADAAELLNLGIDTPLLGASNEQRPMWRWIPENEPYRERYHAVLEGFMSEYFESGQFSREMDELYEILLPYVEKDPTAFCTAEEFSAAFRNLQAFCLLRAESYRRQLDGRLAAESDSQVPEDRVDPGILSISGMK